MAWDPRKDAWLAGFTDGEGCFSLPIVNRHIRGGLVVPAFSIGLRADDAAILRTLQGAFGGTAGVQPAWGNSAPKFKWYVHSKRELAGLVEYFDRFPLRAKKARDFALWREAVRIYRAMGGRDPRLPALRKALMDSRGFDAPDMDAPDLDDPLGVQLALGIDD